MIHISKNKCVGCGLCVRECANNSIEMVDSLARINQADCLQCRLCIGLCSQSAIMEIDERLLIAVGTDDGISIKANDHVGMSKSFQIWAYENGEMSCLETRENVKYREDESKKHGDPGKARATASVLENVDVVIGEIFGPNIAQLKHKFVCAVVRGKRTIAQGSEIFKENINEIMDEKKSKEKNGIVLAQ